MDNENKDIMDPDESSDNNKPDNSKIQKKKKKRKKSYSYTLQKTKNVVYADDEIKDEIPYPSASLLLESAKDEYTKERERSQFLDNKASFFMSAVILVATIFIPIIPFNRFVEFANKANCGQLCFFCLTCVFLVMAFVILAISFKKLYDAYDIRSFDRFNIDNVDDEETQKVSVNGIELGLCAHYKEIVAGNIKINNDKADNIKKGLKYSSIGFLVLTLTSIVMVILIG